MKQTLSSLFVVDESDEMTNLPVMILGAVTLILVFVIFVLAFKVRHQRGKGQNP